MILSTLGRKVVDETDIMFIGGINYIDWAWWIECRLQIYRINGLVKMINNSAKMELDYIDGYHNKYKWALRPTTESIDISDFKWLFYFLQNLSQDFPWGMWKELIKISHHSVKYFEDALHIANRCNKANLNYVLAIYQSDIKADIKKNEELQKAIKNSSVVLPVTNKEVGNNKREEWNKIKDKI